MDENKKKFKIHRMWKYLLFMFAFIFCGFVFNASKVEAAPTISIPESGVERNEKTCIQKLFKIGKDQHSTSN